MLVVPIFDTAAWCLYNSSGVYQAISVINIILAIFILFLQSLHEIDLDFEQHDMLNRRNCLAMYVAFIDPFLQCLINSHGQAIINNLIALIFCIVRIAESLFCLPFLQEELSKLYMTLLGAYTVMVSQLLYIQSASNTSNISMLLGILLTVPLGAKAGLNIYHLIFDKVSYFDLLTNRTSIFLIKK